MLDTHKYIGLILPWPPTINSYYMTQAHTKARVISRKGRLFRSNVEECIAEQFGGELRTITDKMCLSVVYHAPDKRPRDIDNYDKALLDACTHAELWEDDILIDQMFKFRGTIEKGGLVRMYITLAGPILPKDINPLECA